MERFLEGLPGRPTVTELRSLSGGRSAETVRLRISDEAGESVDAVLHVEPDAGPHAGITSARAQFELLRALEPTDVPAPRALWLCDDGAAGQPRFLITDFVAGDAPNPWRPEGLAFLEREREERPGALAEDFVQVLARIHDVEPSTLPDTALPGPGASPSAARREIDRWWPAMQSSARFGDDPVLTYAHQWLLANEPPACGEALVHGDYRVGNLVIDEGRISAVLDWELARLGDPLLDVATVCAPPLLAQGRAAGLWDPDAFVRRYSAVTGRVVDPDALAYYRVMATFKIAGVWVNASEAFAGGDSDLSSLRAGFSVLRTRRMLAETLGLPVGRAAAPAPDAGFARACQSLRDALRADVLPNLDASQRETGVAILSVLGAMALEPPPAAVAELRRDLSDAIDRLRGVVTGLEDDPDAALGGRVASSVRAAFAAMGPRAGTDPATEPLRELVGRCADLSLGVWP